MLTLLFFLTLRKRLRQSTTRYPFQSKLHLYGKTGVFHKWFSSYLDNPTQKCVVNGSFSECCFLKRGIPQGRVLGPVLFLPYINDLPNLSAHSELRMYVVILI